MHFTLPISRCAVMVKRGVMSEARQCIREKNHRNGLHTPDLTGLMFGSAHVTEFAGRAKSGTALWQFISQGQIGITRAGLLIGGKQCGRLCPRGKSLCRTPEHRTVSSHWHLIFRSRNRRHRHYKGIPFFDEWNPLRGGFFWKAAQWIREHLGPKPEGSHLHIVPLSKCGKGFGPWKLRDGGWSIRWITIRENLCHDNKGYLAFPSVEQFEREARRRGYVIRRAS